MRFQRRKRLRRVVWLGLAASAGGMLPPALPDLTAQVIYGQVVEQLTGTPVGRGFVVLIDSLGTELARTLSSGVGRFTLAAPGPGVYRLRSEVIAFRRWESLPISLAANQQLTVLLEITRVPTRLAALTVFGNAVCPAEDGDHDLGDLWEEARKALAAASWSDRELGLRHQLHRYRQIRYDRRQGEDSDEIWVATASGAQPFVSVAPRWLATYGYVVKRDAWEYYGPDADVLLHDSFQDTHCFIAERGRGRQRTMTGLRFEPVATREQSDIAGALWIDTETAELRMIEFRYTNLPYGRGDRRIGGEIYFAPLRSGGWILSSWELRMPIVAAGYSFRLRQEIERVIGLIAIGGETLTVRDEEGVVQYEAPSLATVGGTLTDSSGNTVSDVPLWVSGTGYETRTDATGVFELRALLDGKWRMTTPSLDSLFYSPGVGEVRFEPREHRMATLELPDARRVGRELCRGFGPDERAIVGVLRSVTGDSLPDARLQAVWAIPGQTEVIRAETNDEGRFRICRFPLEATVHIESRDDRYVIAPIEIRFDTDGSVVVRRDAETRYRPPYPVIRVDLIGLEP